MGKVMTKASIPAFSTEEIPGLKAEEYLCGFRGDEAWQMNAVAARGLLFWICLKIEQNKVKPNLNSLISCSPPGG